MPGSAIYLGKQNRVLCRAALVSKKHPSDEDGPCGTVDPDSGAPFFFWNAKKGRPQQLFTREKIPQYRSCILSSSLSGATLGEAVLAPKQHYFGPCTAE